MKKIVTIDGPAGSGKSTIAKLLANRIGYFYLDTGSLYRAVTSHLMSQQIAAKDTYKIAHELTTLKLDYTKNGISINGTLSNEIIRTDEVNQNVAIFAQNVEIRKYIKDIQLKIGNKGNCVVDGRDIGTVIFPDAFCKFYLDATPSIRAERRLKDTTETNSAKTKEQIEEEIKERDRLDKTRTISPLKIPVDALVIDSSTLSIDQVMDTMVTQYNKKNAMTSEVRPMISGDDSKMFLDALENFNPEEEEKTQGTLLKGKIISISNNEVYLDINDKRDAVIPADETAKFDMASLKVGETIDVYLINSGNSRSQIVVSKLEADKRSALILIKDAFETNKTVEGVVTEAVRGGFLVDIKGNSAFCPFSEYDIRKINKDTQVGVRDNFYIIEYTNQKVVVSRKKFLEENFSKVKAAFFENIQEGDILEGEVVNITDFGVFVEIENGITGIIRLKNLSWKRFAKATDIVKKGDSVKVKVMMISADKFKLELSKKETEEDPLIEFNGKYGIGDTLKGEVKHVESFGAFIEVADGLEGLLHVSEMSWTKRINHPNEILHPGDFVETKLLAVDIGQRKISLGLKQVMSNPWDTIEQRYPEGDVVQATVTSIIKNGVYCQIDGEFEGFLHIDNITWSTDKIRLNEQFKEGENIEAKVLTHNKPKKRIELGLKQKTTNPWNDLMVNYGVGGSIFAEVSRVSENGAFIKVSDEIEGFCHISQLSADKIERPEQAVKIGEKYNFLIQVIDQENKKVSLSIREQLRADEKKDIERYLGDETASKTVTIADLLK